MDQSLPPAPTYNPTSPARKVTRCVMQNVSGRIESRTPAQVAVDLSSLDVRTPAQEGVTQNISLHGARIVTTRAWRPQDRLNVRSLRGNLRSRARVVYCEPLAGGSFAIGLELFARTGDWTFSEIPRTESRGSARNESGLKWGVR